jgi:DNA invertase Pin-like site-specific DNA recombinase
MKNDKNGNVSGKYIGYARVSTDDQNLDSQIDALNKKCVKIFTDKISGAKADRVGLNQCLEFLREGDTLVITKLDRLGRSLKDLIQIVDMLKDRNISLYSINDQIDTSTAHGKFFFHIFGAVSEFERDLIRSRTQAGLTAARARGRNGGRRVKMTQEKIVIAKKLLSDRNISSSQIALQLGISKATLYNHISGGRSKILQDVV